MNYQLVLNCKAENFQFNFYLYSNEIFKIYILKNWNHIYNSFNSNNSISTKNYNI